jgi:membrane protein YqaA with SNARE-associated domain
VYLAAQKAAQHAHHLVPSWVFHFGVAGVFAIAVLDSSPFPLPIPGSVDVLILIFGSNGVSPWLLAPMGIAGSLIGSWLTWKTGQKGGEPMVDRYVPERHRDRIKRWVKSHGILSVAIAALLPPPIPLLPFLLAAGALGVTRRQLLTAIGIARTLRYGGEAALTVLYGRQILHWFNRYLAGWGTVIIWSFIGLIVAGIIFGIWKYRHDQRRQADAPRNAHAAGHLHS